MRIGVIFPKDSEAIFDTTSSKTFGGATVQMFAVANEILERGESEVFCVVPSVSPDIITHSRLRLLPVFNIKNSLIGTILLFHRVVRSEKPEVLIQHGLSLFSCLLSLYCRLFNIKFVFMFANDDEVVGMYQSSKKRCWLFPLLLKTANLLVTQNSYQQSVLNKRGVKGTIIRMGFPMRAMSEHKKTVLWVARCEELKQPEVFIELAKQIPNQQFVMICPKVDPAYFQKVKTLAAEVKNLTFIDFVSFNETWKYFEEARVFINTSKNEGFPQTFVQSMVCGTPIISLNVDPDNFIESNQCGFVCSGDKDQLTKSLVTVLDNSNFFAKNALKYAEINHNIKENVSKLLDELD